MLRISVVLNCRLMIANGQLPKSNRQAAKKGQVRQDKKVIPKGKHQGLASLRLKVPGDLRVPGGSAVSFLAIGNWQSAIANGQCYPA
jgi:hypothetical protein